MPNAETTLSEWMDLINAQICPEHILQGQPTSPSMISYLLLFSFSLSLSHCRLVFFLLPESLSLFCNPFPQPKTCAQLLLTKMLVIKALLPFMQKSWLCRTLSTLLCLRTHTQGIVWEMQTLKPSRPKESESLLPQAPKQHFFNFDVSMLFLKSFLKYRFLGSTRSFCSVGPGEAWEFALLTGDVRRGAAGQGTARGEAWPETDSLQDQRKEASQEYGKIRGTGVDRFLRYWTPCLDRFLR